MTESTAIRPFAAFEWMVSLRYLRPRRREGFISVIAGFSFLGILLGVAALIIVMAVMNGFRKELLDKILGLNGHLLIQPLEKPLDDWEQVADRVAQLDGIRLAAPMGTTPRIKAYKVAAIFEIGMSEYDAAFVFMPLPEAQAYFNRANDVTAIEVYTSDPDRIDRFRRAIAEAAGRPIFMIDWRQRNATFFNALQVERNVMFLILSLIVLVAALNIISGLIMLVKDKSSDIAILRTMGATQGAIMRVFLITGASIGVVGTLTGFVVGTLVCLNVESIRQFLSWLTNTELFSPELYFLSRLPADLDPAETIAVVAMALTLSFLATLYPSWRAARIDPVEALRYE